MNSTPSAHNSESLEVRKVRHPLKARMLQVRRLTRLTPAMLRITLTGDDLDDFISGSFDDHVKLFLPASPGDMPVLPEIGPNGPIFPPDQPRPLSRDYTPRRYDPVTKELDIDFVLHHAGPATSWAAQAVPGDYLGIAGPRGSFVIPIAYDWHLLVGDETAIPAISRRLAELPADKQAIVVVKSRKADARLELASACRTSIHWVVQDSDSDEAMDGLERTIRGLTLPAGEGYAWAAGEYTDIKRVRQYLVEELGLDKTRVRAASYWRKQAEATHVNFE